MIETPNFISIYDNALQKDQCTEIINDFENDKDNQVKGFCSDNEGIPII